MSKKYYLGLDVGIQSIGWAVSCDEEGITKIDDFGVILWDPPFKGKVTHNEVRRKYRSARRLRDRKRNKKRLLYFLLSNLNNDKNADEFIYRMKELQVKTNPYDLRFEGLTRKLNFYELGIVLTHYLNGKGYSNAFETIPSETSEEENEEEPEDKDKKKK